MGREFKLNKNQSAAAYTIDRNVIVSAGAGSGKTRVLVERYMHILEKHPEWKPENILAITFTRKAAAEMKERVISSVTQKVEQSGENKKYWQDVVQNMNRAQIFTIDGLCGRILREHPVEAGIDPNFKVLEELDEKEMYAKALDSYLKQALKENNEHLRKLINYYKLDKLRELLNGFLERPHELSQIIKDWEKEIAATKEEKSFLDFVASRYVTSMNQDNGDLESCIERLKDAVETACSSGFKFTFFEKLRAAKEQIYKDLDNAQITTGDLESIDAVLKKPGNWKNEEPKKLLADIKDAEKVLKKRVEKEEDYRVVYKLLESWLPVLEAIKQRVDEEKSKSEQFNFNDISSKTIALLVGNKEIRQKYQDKYKIVMVDEFQDTDEEQRRLVYLLCGMRKGFVDEDGKELKSKEELDAAGSKARPEIFLNSNKLFVVGDPKQSIYRFRGADVSVFNKVHDEMSKLKAMEQNSLDTDGVYAEVVEMGINYRSQGTILELCNELFEKVFRDVEDSNNADNTGVKTKKSKKDTQVKFEALGVSDDNMVPEEERSTVLPKLLVVESGDTSYQSDFTLTAAEIVKLKNEGVHSYGDITILLPVMTKCTELARTLQEWNIPYQIVDGRDFYKQREIVDVLNLMRFLSNTLADIELAGVLRSPYFGFSDSLLTEICSVKAEDGVTLSVWEKLGRFSNNAIATAAYEKLARLQKAASCQGLVQLWQAVFEEIHIDAVLMQQEYGNVMLANVEKLRQMALEFTVTKQGTLEKWLQHIDRTIEFDVRVNAANLPAADVVTIMTVHKSKGLEFPVVILPMMGRQSGNFNKGNLSYVNDIGFGIQILDKKTGKFKDTSISKSILQKDKLRSGLENMRLLYVAMTRAQKRLIMIGTNSKSGENPSWLDVFEEYKPKNVVKCIYSTEKIKAEEQELKGMLGNEQVQEAVSCNTILPPLPKAKDIFTPSDLQSYQHCPREFYYLKLGLPGLELEAEEKTSTRLPASITGKIIHRALELYNGDLETVLQQAVEEEHAGAHKEDIDMCRRILQQYIASDLYQQLPAKQDREYKFIYEKEEQAFVGVIDLLVYNPDGTLKIIDYKTGMPPAPGQKKPGYMQQLAIYKAAVESMMPGKRVSGAELHFLQNGSVMALPEGDEYLQQALDLTSEIIAKDEEADYPCHTDKCNNCPYEYMCKKE